MADDGDSIQGGDRQVLSPQQLLQQPDQSTEDAEVGRSAVGHQLIVTLETHTQVRMIRQFNMLLPARHHNIIMESQLQTL